MAWKDPETRRVYDRAWSKKNSESRQRLNNAWKASRVAWFKDFKRALKCNRCQEDHPATLQFHHRDPATKEGSISALVYIWSTKRILSEIAKCEVLCGNCHAKHHAETSHES